MLGESGTNVERWNADKASGSSTLESRRLAA